MNDSQKLNPYKRDESLNIANKFPKLKLITENEIESIDDQIFNLENQLKKSNSIYSNNKENQPI